MYRYDLHLFTERKLSIASDKQVQELDAKMNGVVGPKVVIDRQLAKALRRRNFLDMCREWKSIQDGNDVKINARVQ